MQQENEKFFQSRYARQIALPEIGEEGQAKLAKARVLIVGVGGLGAPAAMYLVAAGVGRIGLVDGDRVDESNLQRQVLFSESDVGLLKVIAARRRLAGMNSRAVIEEMTCRLEPDNAKHLLQECDFVIDATDNFESKFLIADVCHAAGVPYSHGGIRGFEGQTMTVLPGRTACYRCVFENTPEGAAELPRGPLGGIPGVIGSIQATEAVKYLAGIGTLLTDRLLVMDALEMKFRIVDVARNPECVLCGSERSKS